MWRNPRKYSNLISYLRVLREPKEKLKQLFTNTILKSHLQALWHWVIHLHKF